MAKSKTTIGRYEMVSFPELGIETIESKIDTGAYSSAIHAPKIWLESKEGEDTLYFQLLDKKTDIIGIRTFKTTSFYQKKVRSSNGKIENRYVIKTELLLGGKKRKTHLSLTNRKKMKYPVLIGRRVLKKGFIVDVSISGVPKTLKKKK